jgi:hypothetical protein
MVLGLLLMSDVQKCNTCGLIKCITEFHAQLFNVSGVSYRCKQCAANYIEQVRAPTYTMLNQIKLDAGGCQNRDCQSGSDRMRLLSHEDNVGLFDLDHVDERLKLDEKETSAAWITHNWQEFMERVKPNLQVLCTHCHRDRSRARIKYGNPVHSKAYGRKNPARFVDLGYNLFNQPKTALLFEDDDIEVLPDRLKREDDWFVCRDGYGHLIWYRDAIEGETFGRKYNADGEEI